MIYLLYSITSFVALEDSRSIQYATYRAVTRYKFLAQSGSALRSVRALDFFFAAVRALENYFYISATVRALEFFLRIFHAALLAQ